MTIAISIDLNEAAPPYEQVRAQLAGHIRNGALLPGERLPVVRALAADLGVAPNTVARAYRELAAGGLVIIRRRTGTIVQVPTEPAPPALRAHAGEFVRSARDAGMADHQIVDLVRGALLAELHTNAEG